jgi:hypothetical protein
VYLYDLHGTAYVPKRMFMFNKVLRKLGTFGVILVISFVLLIPGVKVASGLVYICFITTLAC